MNKIEFINRLRWFVANEGRGLQDEYGHPDYSPGRGETILMGMFAKWLHDSDVPERSEYARWFVDLPDLVVEAFQDFSSAPEWEDARRAYKIRTSNPVPDIANAYTRGLHGLLVACEVTRLLPLLANAPWLSKDLHLKVNAEMEVIDLAWKRFVKIVYRKLLPHLNANNHRGYKGRFGSTELLTFGCAGRIMFTFTRGTATMTYVADDGDVFGYRSGPNSPGAPYQECVSMIEDVIENWDANKLEHSDDVGMI